MVNTRMKSGLYALLAGMGLLLGACNSSTDGGATPVTKAELVGKWNFTSFRYTMASTVTPKDPENPNTTIDTTLNLTGSGTYQNLMDDGTYQSVFPDLSFSLLRKISGEGDGDMETGTWSVSGNSLTTVTSDGDTVVFAVVLDGASAVLTRSIDETFSGGIFTYTDKGSITIKATKQ